VHPDTARLKLVGEIDLDGALTAAICRAEDKDGDADVLALAVVEEVCDYLGDRGVWTKIAAHLREVRWARKGMIADGE
jgi:hypothetical protein